MNRLTKDLNTPHDDTTYADIVKDAVDREQIVLTKMKHYEDIEEELGVDLIAFLKECKYVLANSDQSVGESTKGHKIHADFGSVEEFIDNIKEELEGK